MQFIGASAESTEDSIAVFQCEEGFQIDGVQALVCLANSEWSHSVPQCLPMDYDCEIEDDVEENDEDENDDGGKFSRVFFFATHC